MSMVIINSTLVMPPPLKIEYWKIYDYNMQPTFMAYIIFLLDKWVWGMIKLDSPWFLYQGPFRTETKSEKWGDTGLDQAHNTNHAVSPVPQNLDQVVWSSITYHPHLTGWLCEDKIKSCMRKSHWHTAQGYWSHLEYSQWCKIGYRQIFEATCLPIFQTSEDIILYSLLPGNIHTTSTAHIYCLLLYEWAMRTW